MELKEKAVSKKQQRFFGMVRAAQKGEGAASPEVAKVAGEISKKDAKDFAKTKHKGLPEKKKIQESPSIIRAGSRKKSSYRGPTGDHRRDKEGNIVASHYKKKPSPTGEKYGDKSNRPKTPKPADVRKRTKKGETTRSALNRAKKYEREKVRVYQGDAKRKAAKTGEYAKGYNESLTPMQDNNLFGNAYAGTKPPKKKKKKLKEGRVEASYSGGQATFSDFYDRAKEARKAMARKSAKKIEYDKKNAEVTSDTRKHGVKFSDKKGSGRIVKGKKRYD